MAGLKWDSVKAPEFSTKVMRAVSGKELRAAYMSYPLYTFKLSYEVLRDDVANNELKTLAGFFLARQGQYDSFLFTDPSDHAVTAQSFGTGDGTTTAFQLVRAYGGFSEPVQNVNGAPSIYVNGTLKTVTTHYTLSSTGLVTFTAGNIPTSGQALTWTGSYYFRVRFTADMAEFSQFLQNLWELKQLEFVGATGNKV
jgi:uncharacterized protein (TIGR02217 family)